MPITIVGSADVTFEVDDGATIGGITIDYPAGITSGDVIHLAVCLPRYRWWAPQGLGFAIVRQYGFSVPLGWVSAGAFAFNPSLGGQGSVPDQGLTVLLRKVATGAEGADVTIPITRTNLRPAVTSSGEILQVAAAIVAHRGVSIGSPYAVPPVFQLGGDAPWNSGESALSRLTQLAFASAFDLDGLNPQIGDPFPAWTDPTPTRGEPASWDVLEQASTNAIEITSSYDHLGDVDRTQTRNVRAAVLDADTFTPGLAFFGEPPTMGPTGSRWYRVAFALRDASEGPTVDEPPEPGQPGVTGSGWTIPEWIDRERQIVTPLVCTVWAEGSGEYGPQLQLILGEDEAPVPVAADVSFNGLGACTTATVAFPASPGVVPFQHALKLGLRLTADPDSTIVWWTGVVKNVRYENGLYLVDLDGLWSLLNDARVQLDSGGYIDRPTHGAIEGTLVLGIGDPTAVVIENQADAQQTWGEHLNATFRWTPQAAWGVGPDQIFIMGLPEQGGVLELDADLEPAVASVQAGAYILPPFITEWWAEDGDGNVISAELTPQPGLLAPSRLAQSRLDDLGNLLVPKEAMYPLHAGPSHTLVFAGIAVPPLRVIALPTGEMQMVASARVEVAVGEEGNMPAVTTTLTTVALPYERS